ncbi:MAG: hypothetical protein ABSH41_03560 [Syntrophobacteraceae bacterium]
MRFKKYAKIYSIMALCVCLVTASGCAGSNAPPPNPVTQSQPPPEPSAGPGPAYGPSAGPASTPPPAAPSGPRAKFLDFNDIPIPPEINIQSKNSYVFQSGQIKMGFLTLRGRVDPNSVMNFFASGLPREGWRLKGEFRYNRSLLIFDKPDKICVILVKEDTYYTYVEIYVSPVAGT